MPRFTSLVAGVLASALFMWPSLGQAIGEDWHKGCQTGMFSRASSVPLGGFVCASFGLDTANRTPASATVNDESQMISVSQCDNFDVLFFPDKDGAADDAGVTMQIYSCAAPTDASGDSPPDAGWSATGLCWLLQNATLDGDPSTDTEAIYGAAAEWIFALAANVVDDEPVVILRCNPPEN
jgi:hypothetical protein